MTWMQNEVCITHSACFSWHLCFRMLLWSIRVQVFWAIKKQLKRVTLWLSMWITGRVMQYKWSAASLLQWNMVLWSMNILLESGECYIWTLNYCVTGRSRFQFIVHMSKKPTNFYIFDIGERSKRYFLAVNFISTIKKSEYLTQVDADGDCFWGKKVEILTWRLTCFPAGKYIVPGTWNIGLILQYYLKLARIWIYNFKKGQSQYATPFLNLKQIMVEIGENHHLKRGSRIY